MKNNPTTWIIHGMIPEIKQRQQHNDFIVTRENDTTRDKDSENYRSKPKHAKKRKPRVGKLLTHHNISLTVKVESKEV